MSRFGRVADPWGPLPVEPGAACDLTVEYDMGSPSPCAVVPPRDSAGLALAAASARLGDSNAGKGRMKEADHALVPAQGAQRKFKLRV